MSLSINRSTVIGRREEAPCPTCGVWLMEGDVIYRAEEWVPEDRGDGWQGEPYWHLWGFGCCRSCAHSNALTVMERSAYP